MEYPHVLKYFTYSFIDQAKPLIDVLLVSQLLNALEYLGHVIEVFLLELVDIISIQFPVNLLPY
jgi:hypothetical protein